MYLKRFCKLFEKGGNGGEKSVLAGALWVMACVIAGTDIGAMESLTKYLAANDLFTEDGHTHPMHIVDWALQENDPRNWDTPDLESAPHQQSYPYQGDCGCEFITIIEEGFDTECGDPFCEVCGVTGCDSRDTSS